MNSTPRAAASRRHSKFPPGPPPNLFRSLFGALQESPLDYFTDIFHRYGDVIGMRIGNFRTFVVYHPDVIEDVLVNKQAKDTTIAFIVSPSAAPGTRPGPGARPW